MRKRTTLSLLNSVVVGIITGLVVLSVRFGFVKLAKLRLIMFNDPSFVIKILWVVLVVGCAFITSFVLKNCIEAKQSGEDQVQAQLLGLSKPNSIKLILSKIFGSLATSFADLPLDHGGPAMQIGAHTALLLNRKNDREKEKTMMLSGMAAGFAAAFQTPLAAVLFNLEVVNKTFSAAIILPSLIAAVTSDLIGRFLFQFQPIIQWNIQSTIPFHQFHHLLILALIIGIVAALFNKLLTLSTTWIKRLPIGQHVLVLIPFALAIILFFVYPPASGLLPQLENPAILSLMVLLVVRFLFTIISFQSNAVGGLFIPFLLFGSLITHIYGLIGIHYGWFPSAYLTHFMIIGMAGFVAAALKAPLFAIVFVVELTGAPLILPVALVCLIASLTASQLNLTPFYLSQLSHYSGNKDFSFGKEKVMMQVYLSLDSELDQKRVMDLGLPVGTLIISVYRYGQELNVDGQIRLHAGDLVTLVTSEQHQLRITEMFHD